MQSEYFKGEKFKNKWTIQLVLPKTEHRIKKYLWWRRWDKTKEEALVDMVQLGVLEQEEKYDQGFD